MNKKRRLQRMQVRTEKDNNEAEKGRWISNGKNKPHQKGEQR